MLPTKGSGNSDRKKKKKNWKKIKQTYKNKNLKKSYTTSIRVSGNSVSPKKKATRKK